MSSPPLSAVEAAVAPLPVAAPSKAAKTTTTTTPTIILASKSSSSPPVGPNSSVEKPKRIVIPPGHPMHPKTKMMKKMMAASQSLEGVANIIAPPSSQGPNLPLVVPDAAMSHFPQSDDEQEAMHPVSYHLEGDGSEASPPSPVAPHPSTPQDGRNAVRRRYEHRVLDFFQRYDPLRLPTDDTVKRIVSDEGPPEHIFFHLLRKKYGLSLHQAVNGGKAAGEGDEGEDGHQRLALSIEAEHDSGSPRRANPVTSPPIDSRGITTSMSHPRPVHHHHRTQSSLLQEESSQSQPCRQSITTSQRGDVVAAADEDCSDTSTLHSPMPVSLLTDPRASLPIETWLAEWNDAIEGVLPVNDFVPVSWNSATNGSANQGGASARFKVADGMTPGVNTAQRFLNNGTHFVVHHGHMKARADPEVVVVAERLHPYYWAAVGASSSSDNEEGDDAGSNKKHQQVTVDISGDPDASDTAMLDAFAPLSRHSKPKSLTKASERAERKLLLRAVQRMARNAEINLFGTSSDGAVAAACYLHEDKVRRGSRTSSRTSAISSESETLSPNSPVFFNYRDHATRRRQQSMMGEDNNSSFQHDASAPKATGSTAEGDEDGGDADLSPFISSLSSPPSLNAAPEDLLLLDDMDASFKSSSTARRSIPSPMDFE